MFIEQLGWNSEWEKYILSAEFTHCIPARVAEENREIYRVYSQAGELTAELTGKIRFHAENRSDFPAVGDWVQITPRGKRATIEAILPRKSLLIRKAAGREFKEQVIAANIDTLFIVTSLNLDLNLRRLERYLAIAWESGSVPVILLNKCDLSDDRIAAIQLIESIAPGVPIHVMSGLTGAGVWELMPYLQPNRTAALIGSSGVGKSTIINRLAGRSIQSVKPVRESDDRGKHATTTRQMILLQQGGIVIDTPGMREIGMWEADSGVSKAFEEIEELAQFCRFRNCAHAGEPGCAVENAVQQGTLPAERIENYRKLKAELRYQESKTNIEIRRANKAYAKRIGRAIKRHYSRNKGKI